MASERIIFIAQAIYDYLKANRVGAQTTTSEALADAFPDNVPIQSEDGNLRICRKKHLY